MGIEYPGPASLVFPATQPTCRGVGFILYKSIDDATRAIIGLNGLGFDASFAKVGFHSHSDASTGLTALTPDPPEGLGRDEAPPARRPHLGQRLHVECESPIPFNPTWSDVRPCQLPVDFNEEDLEMLFAPSIVKSVRLLRYPEHADGTPGLSRGIGFAR